MPDEAYDVIPRRPLGETARGLARAIAAIARQVAHGVRAKPLALLLVALAAAACGYMHSQRALLEYDFAHPFEAMGAQAIATKTIPYTVEMLEENTAAAMVDEFLQTPHSAAVTDCFANVRAHGNEVVGLTVHGVRNLSPRALNLTQYNAQSLGWSTTDAESALVDADTARQLGVRAGDVIQIAAQTGNSCVEVAVGQVTRATSGARGVIVDDSLLKGFAPRSATLYFEGPLTMAYPNAQAIAAGAPPEPVVVAVRTLQGSVGGSPTFARYVVQGFQTRSTAVTQQVSLAKGRVNDDQNVIYQRVSLGLLCAVAFFYARLRLRQDRINVLAPFEGFGMPWLGSSVGFCLGVLPFLALATAAGLAILDLFVALSYHTTLGAAALPWLFLCDLGACLAAIVIAILLDKLRNLS